jgi:hypothetical protein
VTGARAFVAVDWAGATVLAAGAVLAAEDALLAEESSAGVASLVVGAEDPVTVEAAGATAPVAGAAGPVADGAEGCVGAVDGLAGPEAAGEACVADWAPSALAGEVVVAGLDGAGG